LTSLLLVIALVAVVALVWWNMRKRAARRVAQRADDSFDTVGSWPPQVTRVLTTTEREAYDILRSALPAHMVLAQIPLQRFIKVPTRNSYTEWLRRAGHLCADLVICDRHSLVVAVVEVQAADEVLSERAQKRRQRLARVLKAAHIPVHVWSASSLPTIEAAREAIAPTPPAEDVSPAATPASLRSLPGRPATASAASLAEQSREPVSDEVVEMREPPPSTWFDDLDSAPAPLAPEPPKPSKDRAAR